MAFKKVTEFLSTVEVCGCDFNNYGNIANWA